MQLKTQSVLVDIEHGWDPLKIMTDLDCLNECWTNKEYQKSGKKGCNFNLGALNYLLVLIMKTVKC